MKKPKIHIIDFLTLTHAFNKARMTEYYKQTGTNVWLLQAEYKQRGYKDMQEAIDDAVSIQFNSCNMPKAKDFEINYKPLPANKSTNGFAVTEDNIPTKKIDLISVKENLNELITIIKNRMNERDGKRASA